MKISNSRCNGQRSPLPRGINSAVHYLPRESALRLRGDALEEKGPRYFLHGNLRGIDSSTARRQIFQAVQGQSEAVFYAQFLK
jgi:hypothetical protein